MIRKKNLISICDLSKKEIKIVLNKSLEFKNNKVQTNILYGDKLKGKMLGLLFEKPSTRTMVSFATAMVNLGGIPIFLNTEKLQCSRGESIHDTALVLSRYLNGIIIRTFKHCDLEEFAKYSTIPVINGLTDSEHPCQILSSIMTIMELHKIRDIEVLKKIKIVYIGDGSNNIATSFFLISIILELDLTIISPKQYCVKKELLKLITNNINITSDISLVENADVIYTDVWTSMGFESEKNKRKEIFISYQVNEKLLKKASAKCVVLHCLPAIRGEEITTEIMNKYEYSIFMEVENRLHVQKAILLYFLVRNSFN
ncbi:MAG: ornithine carbamoyltransferase [Endomicrobium sp.]|nr:ornithine carbamoyltransferase [Endomicrobium sp.]